MLRVAGDGHRLEFAPTSPSSLHGTEHQMWLAECAQAHVKCSVGDWTIPTALQCTTGAAFRDIDLVIGSLHRDGTVPTVAGLAASS